MGRGVAQDAWCGRDGQAACYLAIGAEAASYPTFNSLGLFGGYVAADRVAGDAGILDSG